jgi:DNA-binding response OmpR family regulator
MKKRILIIEDDTAIRDIISYVLESEGYVVIPRRPEPVQMVPTYKADLIILDEWVNKKDGHMLCQEIKEIHDTRHLPVIIISTAHNIADIAKSCKADGYVAKPFELDDLVHEVEKCLSLNTSAIGEY